MAKNITLMGADYPDVPAVDLPKTGGGTVRFVDPDELNRAATWADFGNLQLSNCEAHNGIGVKYARLGALVILQIYVKSLTANTRVEIGTLPAGYRPIAATTFIGSGGESYTSKAYFTISENGKIYILPEDRFAQGSFMYWYAT